MCGTITNTFISHKSTTTILYLYNNFYCYQMHYLPSIFKICNIIYLINHIKQSVNRNTMIDFNNLTITKFYPYRRAIVTGLCIDVNETMSKIIREFLTDNGYKMDNHICWKTDNGLTFMYSDRHLYINTKVREERW